MKSTFEELGGTYRQVGDYLLPDVDVPEDLAVGFWGMQRRKYLLEHQSVLYTAMFLGGKLTDHLQEIDRSATQMFDQLVDQLMARNGVIVHILCFSFLALWGFLYRHSSSDRRQAYPIRTSRDRKSVV